MSATILTQIDRGGLEPAPANDTAALDILTTGGAHVCAQVSDAALLGDALFRFDALVLGSEGSLEGQMIYFGADAGARLHLSAVDGSPKLIHEEAFAAGTSPPDFLAVFTRESVGPRGFIDAILAGRPAYPDLFDGAAAQRVIDAAIRSHESGCRVRVAPG